VCEEEKRRGILRKVGEGFVEEKRARQRVKKLAREVRLENRVRWSLWRWFERNVQGLKEVEEPHAAKEFAAGFLSDARFEFDGRLDKLTRDLDPLDFGNYVKG